MKIIDKLLKIFTDPKCVRFLYCIGKYPGIKIGEIQKKTGLSKAEKINSFNQIEDAKLIKVGPNAKIELTKEGAAMLYTFHKNYVEPERDKFEK